MSDLVLALPPRVLAAVRRARPRLVTTVLRGPWGGWTWLAAPALALAARGRSRADILLLLATGIGCVLLLHGGTWLRWRAAAARDPRVPVLLRLDRTRTRLNALLPRARIRQAEVAAGLHAGSGALEALQATHRGLDGLSHALGRALAQQPGIGQLRSGWAGSLGGLDGLAQDLKRLERRVTALERQLEGVKVALSPDRTATVLPFKRRD